ncbi:MAG TPA: hypothetical protein VNH65_04660 [Candidatus Acidoferrum sp.]|nr:hypothetical protein [Candidatus Acidoferrum sp.]
MRYGLWKSVENFAGTRIARAAAAAACQPACYRGVEGSQPAQHACSSCAGDYEDPDRTAWTPDMEEDEERLRDAARDRSLEGPEEEGESNDEFPAVEV